MDTTESGLLLFGWLAGRFACQWPVEGSHLQTKQGTAVEYRVQTQGTIPYTLVGKNNHRGV